MISLPEQHFQNHKSIVSLHGNFGEMKKAVISLMALVLFSCGNKDKESNAISSELVHVSETANGTPDKSKLPVIKFEQENYDFGKIIQGEKVSYTFTFKNEGKANLIVSSAKASCGCTVADPPKEPIVPGATGKINVVFDSNGKSGHVSKSISVITNCEPNTVILTIGGEVIVPAGTVDNK
jgi:hypothetical protein